MPDGTVVNTGPDRPAMIMAGNAADLVWNLQDSYKVEALKSVRFSFPSPITYHRFLSTDGVEYEVESRVS